MDRVRFGRALGFGAKQAVKTLVAAVDAATAENPSARSAGRSANTAQVGAQARVNAGSALNAAAGVAESPRPAAAPAAPDITARRAAQKAAQAVVQARGMQQNLGRGGRRFGEAVWRPFVRLSGVLWLEVSGVFFGIFALLALGYMWKLRGAWHASATNAASHRSLLGAAVMLVLFGYFCVSSFVRARQRERGR
jgi:hypothetical protein